MFSLGPQNPPSSTECLEILPKIFQTEEMAVGTALFFPGPHNHPDKCKAEEGGLYVGGKWDRII